MILGFLTLIIALTISAVAIYYSVAGLVAIFAAAAIPIMIMGGALEIAKLVTAVWLHKYWGRAKWWLKSYLAVAVVVLMFITSMGIFGFLSKAHIEQTTAGQEGAAQVERINTEIGRQQDIVKRAEDKTRLLQTTGSGADAQIQSQIDKEQERIDNAYKRIQPAIDEQNKIIGGQAGLYNSELAKIDAGLAQLQTFINEGDIKKAQAMVGAKADGAFGPNTAAKFKDWQAEQEAKRKDILTKIETATNNPQARAAAAEIKRLRLSAEREVAESNKLINRLRTNVGITTNAADIDKQVDEQNARIKEANTQLDTLTSEKYRLEGEYRKLEAEVGPIKYIAEFVYGEQADKNMLEKAVMWVIVIIIFVFDPLAVLLLIAAQYTFAWHRKDLEDKNEEMASDDWELYERARAQRIVDNPGYEPDDGPLTDKQLDEIQQDAEMPGQEDINENGTNTLIEETTGDDATGAGPEGGDASAGMAMAGEEDLTDVEVQPEVQLDEPNKAVSNIPNTKNRMFYPEELEPKKSIKLPEELEREQEYDLKEQDETFVQNKTVWKDAHPDQTLKHYKNLYVKGVIDSLPWESPAQEDNYKAIEGYQQNAEQNERTLFNKLSKK